MSSSSKPGAALANIVGTAAADADPITAVAKTLQDPGVQKLAGKFSTAYMVLIIVVGIIILVIIAGIITGFVFSSRSSRKKKDE